MIEELVFDRKAFEYDSRPTGFYHLFATFARKNAADYTPIHRDRRPLLVTCLVSEVSSQQLRSVALSIRFNLAGEFASACWLLLPSSACAPRNNQSHGDALKRLRFSSLKHSESILIRTDKPRAVPCSFGSATSRWLCWCLSNTGTLYQLAT